MKSLFWIFVLLMSNSWSLFAQSGNFYGSSTVNEYATSITSDQLGNIFVGIVNNGITQVIKRDQFGQTVWVRSIQLNASNTTQNLASLHTEGDTIFGCGWLRNGSQVLGGYYFKLNASTGTAYWIKFNSSNSTYYCSIQYDMTTNSYLLVGSGTGSNGNLESKVFSVSSSTGNINWESNLNGILFNGFGVNYLDDIMTSSKVVDNKMYFVGRSYVNGASSQNMRTTLFGVDNTGTIFLKKYLNFNNSLGTINRYYGMTVSFDGSDSLIIGQFGDDNCGTCTDFKMSLIKTDLLGNVGWSKSYDILSGNNEILHELVVTNNGYVIMGKANLPSESFVFIQTDKYGNHVQSKKLNITGYTGAIANNNYYVGGSAIYSNGMSYFVGAVNNGNANMNDALILGLDGNLNDANNCLSLTTINVAQSNLTPYSENLNFASIPQAIAHSNGIQSQVITPVNCSVTLPSVAHHPSCDQDSIVLSGLPAGYTIDWLNGATGTNYVANNLDTLQVTVSNTTNCCSADVSIVPFFNVSNFTMVLPSDTIVCLTAQQTYQIDPSTTNINSSETYIWSTGLSGQGIPMSLNVDTSGQYMLTVSNQCVTISDSIFIHVNRFPEILVDSFVELCPGQLPYSIQPLLTDVDSIVWSNGLNSSSYDVTQTEVVSVTGFNSCGLTTENIEIILNEVPTIDLVPFIDSCIQENDQIAVFADVTNADQITWSNGDIDEMIEIQNSGVYYISVSNACGSVSDSIDIELNYFPWMNLPEFIDTCFDSTGFTFVFNDYFGNLVFNDSVLSNTIWIDQEGYLYATVSNLCGVVEDSAMVVNVTVPGTLISEDSLRICDKNYWLDGILPEWVEDPVWLDPYMVPFDNNFQQSGWYYVVTNSACGGGVDSVYIDFIGESNLYLPNTFTPNADEVNERFDDLGINYSIVEISILNRWGEVIYSEQNDFSGWDGTYKGAICPDGMYIVKLIVVDCAGMEKELALHLNLLR